MFRLHLVVLLAVAVLAIGILPPEHLHHSTATHPQVVHSHLGNSASTSTPPHAGCVCVDDDDHDSAVDLDSVMASGPSVPSLQQPAIVPESARAPELWALDAALLAWEPQETPSPPPRPTAPRAPPA